MSAIKYYGGKHYLAKDIVARMPPHHAYVEPFFGSGAVLFARSPGQSETVNDIDGNLTNFWQVLQDEERFARFRRIIEAVPFSEYEFNAARRVMAQGDSVMSAVAFFVLNRQSYSSAGRGWAPPRHRRTRRGMNQNVSAWLSAIDGLDWFHERLRGVVIMNRTAIHCIESQDGPETLIYCDPPYLPETRRSLDVYTNEMTVGEHNELLRKLRGCLGKVMLSGYRSEMYDDMLANWHRFDFDVVRATSSRANGTHSDATECLWVNYL